MRILILCHNLIERGNYFRALHFARFLSQNGFEVTLMPSSQRWYKPKKYCKDGMEIIESPSYSLIIGNDEGWSPLGVLYRTWTAIKNKYDVVYGFSHKPVDCIPCFFARIFRKSWYITDWCDWWGKGGLHEMIRNFREENPRLSKFKKTILGWYDKMEEILEEWAPRKAHLVTVICNALHERALKLGIPGQKILPLISGADLENIHPQDKQKSREAVHIPGYLSESGRNEDTVILGYIANYHLDEHLILEAMSRVYKSRSNVLFLVVGADFRVNEDQMKKWELSIYSATSSSPIKNTDNIIHFGRRPFHEMNHFLGACDILLLPLADTIYNRGRWPHKIGDYLASGRPVVLNDVGDIPELVKTGNAGYAAKPDVADFTQKILDMIDQRDEWDHFGSNARKTAEERLDWNQIGGKLLGKIREQFPKR